MALGATVYKAEVLLGYSRDEISEFLWDEEDACRLLVVRSTGEVEMRRAVTNVTCSQVQMQNHVGIRNTVVLK